MILWLLLSVVVVWVAVFRYRRRNMYRLAASIPSVDLELPIIGIAHTLTGNTEDIMDTLKKFSYNAMQNDGCVTAWLSHILYFKNVTQTDGYHTLCYGYFSALMKHHVQNILSTPQPSTYLTVVVHPADLETVLKTCLEKDDLHRFIRRVIGYGGIFAPVAIWRRRRKILVPAFTPKIVENFVEVFSEHSEKLTKQLVKAANAEKFSIWPFLSTYTLDSVCDTAMGVKINAQGNPNSVFLKSLNRVLNLVCERIFHLWLQPEWLYKLFRQSKEHDICIKKMHEFTDDVIRKKRDEISAEKLRKKEEDQYDLSSYKRKTFLDLLIKLSGGEKGYSNEELREEILTLTVAGTDTSAVCIGYTLKLMGKYPEVQEKVYQELYEIYGDSDRPLVKEDLVKLKYLERVVKESLRLFPPVPFVIRKVLEDTKLPSGRTLPAGSGLVVSIWGAHRDPNYWGPDAEHFDPDRFLPERFNVSPCSYMPFSNGPRNCLGYQYALMSIKTSLAAILRSFKVIGEREAGPIPNIRVKLDIMMKAVDGYELALERRNKTSNFAQGYD